METTETETLTPVAEEETRILPNEDPHEEMTPQVSNKVQGPPVSRKVGIASFVTSIAAAVLAFIATVIGIVAIAMASDQPSRPSPGFEVEREPLVSERYEYGEERGSEFGFDREIAPGDGFRHGPERGRPGGFPDSDTNDRGINESEGSDTEQSSLMDV
jgi:hypothetical protein